MACAPSCTVRSSMAPGLFLKPCSTKKASFESSSASRNVVVFGIAKGNFPALTVTGASRFVEEVVVSHCNGIKSKHNSGGAASLAAAVIRRGVHAVVSPYGNTVAFGLAGFSASIERVWWPVPVRLTESCSRAGDSGGLRENEGPGTTG